MNDGADSAYYLSRGFRVVAVEANPILAKEAESRFAVEVEEGRFAVANVGIADHEGEAEFWVCDDWSAWSSFNREIAGRNGKRHHAETVQLRTMSWLVGEFGMPFYCKVDIEGHDHYCLQGLSPDSRPSFISVELSEFPLLEEMRALGYDRFKMINQLSFSQISGRWYTLRDRLPNEKARAGVERIRGALRGGLNDGRWYFKIGSSGPLPTLTPGNWVDFEQMSAIRQWMDDRYKAGDFGLLDCFDLHATTASTVD
jgi:FkbM family methyltransferase